MAKVASSIIINRPVKEVFGYAASPVHGPAFIPNLSENTNIKPQEPGLGQTFDWKFTLAGVDITGKAEVAEYEYPKRVKIVTSGGSNSTWIYSFEEKGEGTEVSVGIEYEITENILKKIANKLIIDKLNERTTREMLENLKIILEGERN